MQDFPSLISQFRGLYLPILRTVTESSDFSVTPTLSS